MNTLIYSWEVAHLGIRDPESITWMGSRRFTTTDENPASIYVIELQRGRPAVMVNVVMSGLPAPYRRASENLGFEGVAYVPADEAYYAIQEMSPASIWRIDADHNIERLFGGRLRMDQGERPLNVTSAGDLFAGCDDLFIVAKAPRPSIHRIDRHTGEEIERFAGDVCKMEQPEGIAFYHQPYTDKMTMLVVGEPIEVRVFEASGKCIDDFGSTTGDDYSCPEELWSDFGGCEKTLEEHPKGCELRRCAKQLNTHEKVCTELMPCSLEDCYFRCSGSSHFKCMAFSYDEAERECYIWESCIGEGYDPYYSTWVMVDPTCEKTLEDGGCPTRRCGPDNPHVAVCHGTEGDPETPCSKEECYAHCIAMRGAFTCRYFMHDDVDKDCYLYASCEHEGWSDDYTVYKIADAEMADGLPVPGAAACPGGSSSLLNASPLLLSCTLLLGLVVGVALGTCAGARLRRAFAECDLWVRSGRIWRSASNLLAGTVSADAKLEQSSSKDAFSRAAPAISRATPPHTPGSRPSPPYEEDGDIDWPRKSPSPRLDEEDDDDDRPAGPVKTPAAWPTQMKPSFEPHRL